ncbi:MAG: ECF transporter S component [Candidatus Coproplasma sp.]
MNQTTASKGGARYFSSTRIAVIAVLSAISTILYVLKFPISAIFPSWLELNFSDIPALIGTFALGPLSGAIIVVVKILLELIFTGTSTMFVGDLADIIMGCAFVVPAGLIYKNHRTFKGALVGLAVGSFCSTAVGILANWLILVPFYVEMMFHGSWDVLLGGMSAIFGEVTRENFYTFYLWCSVLPFNVMRCLIATLVVLPVYKHISRVINRLNTKLAPKVEVDEAVAKKRNVITIVVCVAVVLLLVGGALLRYFLTH